MDASLKVKELEHKIAKFHKDSKDAAQKVRERGRLHVCRCKILVRMKLGNHEDGKYTQHTLQTCIH